MKLLNKHRENIEIFRIKETMANPDQAKLAKTNS